MKLFGLTDLGEGWRYGRAVDDAPPAEPTSTTTPLGRALDDAGWGPRDLTRAVNAWLTERGRTDERIDATAAYPWVRFGFCPRRGIDEVVATVVSHRLGRYVGAEELWPDRARTHRAPGRVDLPSGGIEGALRSLEHLAAGGRPTLISSTDLTFAAILGLREEIPPPAVTRGRDRVHPSQAALIAEHVTALRQLDDRQGGGALSLRYVFRELGSVLELLRCGSYEPQVADTLLTSIADLAQLAGWMHFDAGATDVAQQLLVLAIHIARAARDNDRAANNAGMLAYIAAETGAGGDSVAIADAASRMPTTSRLLEARIVGRQATAHAADGNISGFYAATDRARELLDSARLDHTEPFLYYLTPDQLAAEAGYSLVKMAHRSDLHRRKLLAQAAQLLAPRAQLDHDPGYQRSAVLHGCQLAQVYLMLGDLDATVAAARSAAALLPEVQSGRCVTKLRVLHKALGQRRRSRVVGQFLPELEQVLIECN